MYAAILTSIETGEYMWESNFDRFETILYRRVAAEPFRGRVEKEKPRTSRHGIVETTTKKM